MEKTGSQPARREEVEEVKAAQAAVEAINRELLAVHRIHQALFACQTVPEVARTLTDALVREFDAYFARVSNEKPQVLTRNGHITKSNYWFDGTLGAGAA